MDRKEEDVCDNVDWSTKKSSSIRRLCHIALGIIVSVSLIIMLGVYTNSGGKVAVTKVNLKDLLSVSIEIAERGGMEAVRYKAYHRTHAGNKGQTREQAKELKTEGARRSYSAIMAGFLKTFPLLSTRIVSEKQDNQTELSDVESANKTRPEVADLVDENIEANDITIWIDPLDDAQDFAEDLNMFVTVMICVAVKGKPVIGVINRPLDSDEYPKETVWAWVGRGISENMNAKRDTQPTDTPAVIISRSSAFHASKALNKAFEEGGTVVAANGHGYKALEVVRGKADIYAHVTLIKKWDICAGDAMLRAVRGEMRSLKDEEINYDMSSPPDVENGILSSMNNNLRYYMDELAPYLIRKSAPPALNEPVKKV